MLELDVHLTKDGQVHHMHIKEYIFINKISLSEVTVLHIVCISIQLLISQL